MPIIPLNTFDEVAAHYAAVKPLRGSKHRGDDLRPIGKRSRKWERVVKMDENTYLLTDAHYGDPIFTYWEPENGVQKVITREEQTNLAPIVWRRHPDGSETVTARNATGGWGQHNARYSFLQDFLPRGLLFCMNRSGDHYVARALHPNRGHYAPDSASYDNKHYLSISTTVPSYILEDLKQLTAINPNGYQLKYMKWMTDVDDGAAVTFKRKSGCIWSFVAGGRPRTVELPRVMADVKAPYKEKIAAFINYCFIMRPMMQISWQQQTTLNTEVEAWQATESRSWPIWGGMARHIPNETARAMLDPEHPMYLHFAYALMYDRMSRLPQNDKDLANMKAGMNRWINKTLGFVTTVVEERK